MGMGAGLRCGGMDRHKLIAEAFRGWPDRPIRFLEIGYDKGDLWEMLKDEPGANGVEYTTVDIIEGPKEGRSRPKEYIRMDSVNFWRDLPRDKTYHVVFVDGCHCDGHTDIDVKGAILHLEIGGTLFMHDTGGYLKTDRQGLLSDAGPSRAFLRNFLDRPEVNSEIDLRHPGGMGVIRKLLKCGVDFLLATYDPTVIFTCPLRHLKPIPTMAECFPYHFMGDER